MNTHIEVTLREVYGVVKAYPENAQARLLAQLAGTKTLTLPTLRLAQAMGFELVYVDRFGLRSQGGEVVKMILSKAA